MLAVSSWKNYGELMTHVLRLETDPVGLLLYSIDQQHVENL